MITRGSRVVAGACALCGAEAPASTLAEAGWLSPEAVARLAAEHPGWRRDDGACPACVQRAILEGLLARGANALREGVQSSWPLDPEAAFGALPAPLRLHADPRFSGRGVAIAFVDAGFFPHDDLTVPRNRIRAWVDASDDAVRDRLFTPDDTPRWPGWDAGSARPWHGLMTSTVAAGNGTASRGLYAGLAPEADVVLVEVAHPERGIRSDAIARALDWLRAHARDLGVRIVSVSVAGDPVDPLAGNAVDEAVRALVEDGIVVCAAAGNAGERRLVPPATAPHAITVGGLDDRNTLDAEAWRIWTSSYGATATGSPKPEVVAPSLWVVAPLLPGTDLAREAGVLFRERASLDPWDARRAGIEGRIAELKLVTPFYRHVEGTSFAAPIVAATSAAMLEANPSLTPRRIRELLVASAHRVAGADDDRQGAGAVDAGRAVALALADRHSRRADFRSSPIVLDRAVRFVLHDHAARTIEVFGAWDGWAAPGLTARETEPGLWEASLPRPAPGDYPYKLRRDGASWLCDPANPVRASDGAGNWNSVLRVGSALEPSR